jgi:hypothetical protein
MIPSYIFVVEDDLLNRTRLRDVPRAVGYTFREVTAAYEVSRR